VRFLGCTCVTDQLRVPNAVITLARLSLTENGRSGSRKKKHNSVSTIKKEKGLHHYLSIILFIEAETVDSGIKTTEFLRLFFFTKKNL
jgi:hypothetical protein